MSVILISYMKSKTLCAENLSRRLHWSCLLRLATFFHLVFNQDVVRNNYWPLEQIIAWTEDWSGSQQQTNRLSRIRALCVASSMGSALQVWFHLEQIQVPGWCCHEEDRAGKKLDSHSTTCSFLLRYQSKGKANWGKTSTGLSQRWEGRVEPRSAQPKTLWEMTWKCTPQHMKDGGS